MMVDGCTIRVNESSGRWRDSVYMHFPLLRSIAMHSRANMKLVREIRDSRRNLDTDCKAQNPCCSTTVSTRNAADDTVKMGWERC